MGDPLNQRGYVGWRLRYTGPLEEGLRLLGYQKNVTPRAGDLRAEAAFPENCCEGAALPATDGQQAPLTDRKGEK